MNEIEFRKFLEQTIEYLKQRYKENDGIKSLYDNENEFTDDVLRLLIDKFNAKHPYLNPEQMKKYQEIYQEIIKAKD